MLFFTSLFRTQVKFIHYAFVFFVDDEHIFIIGGAQIYKQAIASDLVDRLDITQVHHEFEADVFFPEIKSEVWKEVSREDFLPD